MSHLLILHLPLGEGLFCVDIDKMLHLCIGLHAINNITINSKYHLPFISFAFKLVLQGTPPSSMLCLSLVSSLLNSSFLSLSTELMQFVKASNFCWVLILTHVLFTCVNIQYVAQCIPIINLSLPKWFHPSSWCSGGTITQLLQRHDLHHPNHRSLSKKF